MKIFLELTRERNGEKFLANLDHIQSITPAEKGCHIVWSNLDYDSTQDRDEYDELHSRIKYLMGQK